MDVTLAGLYYLCITCFPPSGQLHSVQMTGNATMTFAAGVLMVTLCCCSAVLDGPSNAVPALPKMNYRSIL